MKNLKIKILIGIPASGKSTWAINFLKNNSNYVRVNRDSYRLMLRNQSFCEPKVEGLISKMVKQDIYKSLASKLNVIIDATNVKQKYINEFVEEYKYYADIDYQVFDISLEKAIDRDNNRTDKVGEEVIKRMFKDYKILLDSFDFQPVNKVKQKPYIIPEFKTNLSNCVIFDIDGTIALMKNRLPFEWKKVYKDDINTIVAEHIKFHKDKGRFIILLTGRDGSCRKETEEWLELYSISYDELHMRDADDYRKDTVVKRELYLNHIKSKYNVLAVYDDRLQVLDMWNKEGIFTFNVNQGNIEF